MQRRPLKIGEKTFYVLNGSRTVSDAAGNEVSLHTFCTHTHTHARRCLSYSNNEKGWSEELAGTHLIKKNVSSLIDMYHLPPTTQTHTYCAESHHHTHAQCQSRTETRLQKFPLRRVLKSIVLLTEAFDWTSVFILLPKAADKTCHFSAPHISQTCGSTVCHSWGLEKFKWGKAARKQRKNSKVWYTVACHLCPQFKWLHFVCCFPPF